MSVLIKLFFLFLFTYQSIEAVMLNINYHRNLGFFTIEYIPDTSETRLLKPWQGNEARIHFYETATETEAYRLLGPNISYPYTEIFLGWIKQNRNTTNLSGRFSHNTALNGSWWMYYDMYVVDEIAIRYSDTDNLCQFIWQKVNSTSHDVAYGNCTKVTRRITTIMPPISTSNYNTASPALVAGIVAGTVVGLLVLVCVITITAYLVSKKLSQRNQRWNGEMRQPELVPVATRQVEVPDIMPSGTGSAAPPPAYEETQGLKS